MPCFRKWHSIVTSNDASSLTNLPTFAALRPGRVLAKGVIRCHDCLTMGTVTKSLRIPKETLEEIERAAHGRDFSATANELLSEALKMRRCPGILFADGATGRRARIAGTGLDVWEVIATYRSLGNKLKRLGAAYPQ